MQNVFSKGYYKTSKKTDLKSRFILAALIMLILIIIIWAFFYLIVAKNIRETTEAQLKSISNQIIGDLGSEFARVEQLTLLLAQNKKIQEMVLTDSNANYFELAGLIQSDMDSTLDQMTLLNSLILYNKNETFYRFYGNLGNTACKRVGNLLDNYDYLSHITLTADEQNLIGYGYKISDENSEKSGGIALLIDETTWLNQLSEYYLEETFHVVLVSDNEIVLSNFPEYLNQSVEVIEQDIPFYVKSRIGISGYDMLVATTSTSFENSMLFFTFATIVTTIIFLMIIATYGVVIHRQLFKPMIYVIEQISDLEITAEPELLEPINNPDFDKLVYQINKLLIRIEKKNRLIQEANNRVLDAELENQKAIIYALKKQINAHFTVNSINIIKILISKGELEKARFMCSGLSALISYAYNEDDWVNAWDEFELLQTYVEIMNIRYQNRILLEMNLDDRLMDNKMPRMLLQPIIENSMIHGLIETQKQGKILITAKIIKFGDLFIETKAMWEEKQKYTVNNNISQNNSFRISQANFSEDQKVIFIEIYDNGKGISEQELCDLKKTLETQTKNESNVSGISHIALSNVKKRLMSYFPQNFIFEISSETSLGKGFSVKIIIAADKCH